jgi:HlyD family secretion protein
MKRVPKILLIVFSVVLVVVGAATFFNRADASKDSEVPSVIVTRGSITDKALAVGTIEPRVQISVKSQLSGVVSRQFAEPGELVRQGQPLLEVRPTPTPQEIVDARRQIELREIELASVKREYERQKGLADKQLISSADFETVQRRLAEAEVQVKMAVERLELLQSGRIANEVATVIRAPITGFVLDKNVEIGDPVVPLTSFQEGTVLMTMADMSDLIFRGTVDEIDVGRLVEGMPVEIRVGALPRRRVEGELSKIWLKARTQENSTVFPIEIALGNMKEVVENGAADENAAPIPSNATLRAGYSANAEVIVASREDVLLVPERVISFEGGQAFVDVLFDDGSIDRRMIQTGLSDAIQIEVLSGLTEGERLRERPVRQIQ